VSHPICVDCAGLLQTGLQKELEELSRERDAYINFERGILRNQEQMKKGLKVEGSRKRRKSTSSNLSGKGEEQGLGEFDLEGDEEEWEELTRRRRELESEEERLIRILEGKEKELATAKEEEKRANEEEKEVERQETEYVPVIPHERIQRMIAWLTMEGISCIMLSYLPNWTARKKHCRQPVPNSFYPHPCSATWNQRTYTMTPSRLAMSHYSLMGNHMLPLDQSQ
jgi:hypothetical protein